MKLLPLGAPQWESYRGGYNRAPFNCVPLIEQLRESGATDSFWTIVWDELHHQGDVGEATYAVIPYLAEHVATSRKIDSQLLAFVAIVEYERHQNRNPEIPPELVDGYEWAVEAILQATLQMPRDEWNPDIMRFYAALVAAWKRLPTMSAAYQEMGDIESREFLARFFDDPFWLES